jgi:hypothetical protein
MWLQNIHPSYLPFVRFYRWELVTSCRPFEQYLLKFRINRVGDFQVAISGGFWVAVRVKDKKLTNLCDECIKNLEKAKDDLKRFYKN